MEHGRPKIDYKLVSNAIDHYTNLGFKYLEVPWIVPREYCEITYEGKLPFTTEYGTLVGSAEQSLLMLGIEGKLLIDQNYVCATPCFRDDKIDDTHQKSFFKVELFSLGRDRKDYFLYAADKFFMMLGLETKEIMIDKDQIDLCCKNIELGSYGNRQYNDLSWSYGTGLAEPRTSFVLNL